MEPERPHDRFRLGQWLVEPGLNRLSGEEGEVQLEPKMMDVLTFLWRNAGEVVSKRDILDAVWFDVVTTEGVVTRAVAGLRRALGDDASSPRFIETISKRGYRLIPTAEGSLTAVSPRARADGRAVVPYVVGQWVRGPQFYGRSRHLEQILDGHRNWIWVLGMRRVGKTSLLKHVEHLASGADSRFLPVYWDLQGSDRPAELHLDFHDALLDAAGRLRAVGVEPEALLADDLFETLSRLRRGLAASGRTLLLLWDEVEELIQLERMQPGLLRKMRRALQSREGLRSVLASGPRLWSLAASDVDTSPFLDGFTPPLYLGALEDAEARSLIRQSRLPEVRRPEVEREIENEILRRCGGHPYLIQMVCSRLQEVQDLEVTLGRVAADRSVGFFCSVDYELLTAVERVVVSELAEGAASVEGLLGATGADPGALDSCLVHLEQLGVVSHDESGRYAVASAFFAGWLREHVRSL